MRSGLFLATDYAPYVTGIFALIGSLVGVLVAFQLARAARMEERLNWLKDQRQEVYPRFVAAAQSVLDACEELPFSELVKIGGSRSTSDGISGSRRAQRRNTNVR